MKRRPDERANISRGRLAGPYSTRLRENIGTALTVAVANSVEGLSLVRPRVRPRAAHRVLKRIAATLNPPPSREAEAVFYVLQRTHRALGLFCQRNPEWTANLVADLEKQSPVQ